ncbi:MAG: thiamine pyrophosphate-binding protein [Lachnospiraceae bacterium]|nr:thiamine pyrophosphate-binding protein [Lachnospiraceae bacterium]
MRIRLADYIADFLVSHGVRHNFSVTGGGAMHLNDAFGHKEGLETIYNHHEQACSIAAEGYARLTGNAALVCVTSGPGGTNAITGVLGAWQDSIPMFVISGQVKRETTTAYTGATVRQLGDQEYQIVESVRPMTKYVVMITEPESIRYHLEKAWFLCNHGRKGPVWIDVPVDVQGAVIETDGLAGFNGTECLCEEPIYDKAQTDVILERLKNARRPVILAGTGIRLSGAYEEFLKVIDALQIPVVTAWNAHDLLWDEHPLYCGRPGTVGNRGGNFVVQKADCILILGCRCNIRQISYNYKCFAENAFKIMVDIDANELDKPTLHIDMKIHADVKDVLRDILSKMNDGSNSSQIESVNLRCEERVNGEQENAEHVNSERKEWLSWARDINEKYPVVLSSYYNVDKPLNPYAFLNEFSKMLPEGEKVICGNGSACVMTFQSFIIKKKQRLFTNSGCAAMGYGFPAALGCAVAEDGKRIICIDGDGSFMMNLQELATVAYHKFNLKIVLLNNNGYHSIRQTQTNLFSEHPLTGVNSDNGVGFPDFKLLTTAFGVKHRKLDCLNDIKNEVAGFLEEDGPVILEVFVDEKQNFEPKLASKRLEDGTMVSPKLDDMYPFLQ